VFFARGVTERAPNRHRPLAWPLDSAVGVEASFAGHFTRTLLVWIGSVHSLALGYCRLPTQACVCFVKLKDSLHYQKLWPQCSASLRRVSDYGYLFVAFRPDLFGPADTFERQVMQLIERIKATPRQPGLDDIRIPSERAFRSRERALREGLEIDRVVFDALVALRAQ